MAVIMGENIICYRDPSKDIQKTVTDTTKPIFNEVVIESDLYATDTNQRTLIVGVRADGTCIEFAIGSETSSPAVNTYKYHYDSSANKCYISTTGIYYQTAFPLCIATSGSSGFTSIDQVFNGFGYIGSTVFALPGVKGLIPNGRNADGSLKNIETIVKNVITYNGIINGNFIFGINENADEIQLWWSSIAGRGLKYDEQKNRNYEIYDGTETKSVPCGSITTQNNKISNLTYKTAFHAVDRNDSPWLSGLGMPSGKYINVTLLASGSTYTAPANGWFSGVCGGDVRFENNSNGMTITTGATSLGGGCAYIPVKKGDAVMFQYSTSAYGAIRFYYAEGEAN